MTKPDRKTLTLAREPAPEPRNPAQEIIDLLKPYLAANPGLRGVMILGQTDGKVMAPQYICAAVENDAHGQFVTIPMLTDWLGMGIEWTREQGRQMAARKVAKAHGKEQTHDAPASVS